MPEQQSDHAADGFFATICMDQLHGWERRLADHYAGQGRKPRPKGKRGSPPVPSVEATLRAVREQQRRAGLRPKATRYEFTDAQLAVAARVLEGKTT